LQERNFKAHHAVAIANKELYHGKVPDSTARKCICHGKKSIKRDMATNWVRAGEVFDNQNRQSQIKPSHVNTNIYSYSIRLSQNVYLQRASRLYPEALVVN